MECEYLVLVVVPGDTVQLASQDAYVVIDQLWICTTYDQDSDPRIVKGKQLGLGPYSPALAPTAS